MNADGSIRDASTLPAQPYPGVGGNPFGAFDQLGTKAFTSVGDGSPPPYLAYDPGFSKGLGKVPTLNEGEPGGTAVSLPSNSPFFPGSAAGGPPFVSLPSSLPSDRSDPSDGLRPPATSFVYAANPSPMSGPPFAGAIAGEGLSAVDQSDAVEPGVRPMPGGGADPNIVRVAGGEQATADDEVQVAQAPPAGSRGGSAANPAPTPPGRNYGVIPQVVIERGMTPVQKKINRDQAFRELTRQQLTAAEARRALPDDWESTKPVDIVSEIKRAAERHGVPMQLLARLLYQEGKFNEVDKLGKELLMDSDDKDTPIGHAQMTKNTLQNLKDRAARRGDTKRSQELATYSLANREQSFDAAAEQLSYLYRLVGGSWPKAVAAYNVGPGLSGWFNGANMDPRFFAARTDAKGNLIPSRKWTHEIPEYLRFIFRGASEDPATVDMYDYQPPSQYRARDRIYRPAVPADTRRNP
ncbi:MAG TPA: transglycosylase SLT domain-containing protein [Bauldia sp.]|nr:transglycosylase SLT domain-containing protein [Bauldia sp.]